jgi:hypothetical protein
MNLAERWLRYYVQNNDEYMSAREELETLVYTDPDTAWNIIRELVDKAPDEKTLSSVGAGPLEALLIEAGPRVVDDVTQAARDDQRMKNALSCVWEFEIDDEVWRKVREVFGLRTP